MKRDKALEAILVITTGFLVLYLIYKYQAFLYVSVFAGLIGIFIKPLANIVAYVWFKIGDFMGLIVSKLVLGVIFFLLLIPISTIYKIFNKDTLKLKRSKSSLWNDRHYTYVDGDFKKSW